LDKKTAVSGKLSVSSLEIEPWCEYGPIDYLGEIVYYVLSGRGNLAYGTAAMYDWESDSYCYIAPRQRHSMLGQGETPLIVLKVEYDAEGPRSVKPWGVPIFKRDRPMRVDYIPGITSIVMQTPQSLEPMGAEHFGAIEYEIVQKAPRVDEPEASEPKPEKPTSETVNYVVRGRGKYLIDGKPYPVQAGSLVYSSGARVQLIDIDQWTLDFLFFWLKMYKDAPYRGPL